MRICIPIRAKNAQEAYLQVGRALKMAEKAIGSTGKKRKNGPKIDRKSHQFLLEIWFDCIPESNLKSLIKTSGKPVIAVCRAAKEKGLYKGSESERIEVLKKTVESGAKFVDVGIHTNPDLIKNLKKICKKHGAKLIISNHVWDSTPDLKQLLGAATRAEKLGADIIKVATFARKYSDNVILFELTARVIGEDGEIIALAMGKRGEISRIGCPLLGSYLAYAALDKNSKTAPGQLTLSRLKEIW